LISWFLVCAGSIGIFLLFYGPGRLIAARLLPNHPNLHYAVTPFISGILFYLMNGLIYFSGIDPVPVTRGLIIVLLAIILLRYRSKLKTLIRADWQQLKIHLFIYLFFILLAATLSIYDGGGWYGDWYEHYQRSLFFSEQQAANTTFLGIYLLPARPPFFNLVSAFWFGLAGSSFWSFQLISIYLNSTVFIALLGGIRVLRDHFNFTWVQDKFVLLLLIFPFMQINSLITVTKFLAGGYFIIGVVCYFAAWRRGFPVHDNTLVLFSAASLAASWLVHYSTAPFSLLLLAHWLWQTLRQLRVRRKTLLAGIAIMFFLVASWLIPALQVYGINGTFFSNTSAMSRHYFSEEEKFSIDVFNYRMSLVPFFFWQQEIWLEHAYYIKQNSLSGIINDISIMYTGGSLAGSVSLSLIALFIIILIQYRRTLRKTLIKLCKNKYLLLLAGTLILGYSLAVPANPYYTINNIVGVSLYPVAIPVCAALLGLALFCYQRFPQNLSIKLGYYLFIGENLGLSVYRVFCHRQLNAPGNPWSATFYENWHLKISYGLRFIGDFGSGEAPGFYLLGGVAIVMLVSCVIVNSRRVKLHLR